MDGPFIPTASAIKSMDVWSYPFCENNSSAAKSILSFLMIRLSAIWLPDTFWKSSPVIRKLCLQAWTHLKHCSYYSILPFTFIKILNSGNINFDSWNKNLGIYSPAKLRLKSLSSRFCTHKLSLLFPIYKSLPVSTLPLRLTSSHTYWNH